MAYELAPPEWVAAMKQQLVEEVNQAANIPFTRVVEAMDLTP